jgi:hypothetical protein
VADASTESSPLLRFIDPEGHDAASHRRSAWGDETNAAGHGVTKADRQVFAIIFKTSRFDLQERQAFGFVDWMKHKPYDSPPARS